MEATLLTTLRTPLYWQEDLHDFLISRGFIYAPRDAYQFRYHNPDTGIGFYFKTDMVEIIGWMDADPGQESGHLVVWQKFTNPGTLESFKQIVKAYLNTI